MPLSPRQRPSRRYAPFLLTLYLLCGACSLVVRRSADQCSTDGDCAHFGGNATCQEGVCAPPGPTMMPTMTASTMPSASSTLEPSGCFSGVPASSLQFLNQCSGARCKPFDNCVRMGLCNSAPLPSLTAPPSASH